ncbi:helix-turn-helix transcriptional regulator [Streptomyces sp. ODS28]|uniref:helix-turn-helix domain-containing protein n=1 Tax=Streptomyces sp. ODS28 TaxID=3136688 RepID=UPI0031F02979
MAEQPSEESARETLARTLRMLRERAGKSLAQVAEDTAYDKSYLCRLESGERLSKLSLMADLDAYYDTGDLLVRLWRLAQQDTFDDQFKAFMRYESSAVLMYKYVLAVPGLLQTEGYARAVLSSVPGPVDEGAVEAQVDARMGRQELLRRDPAPNVRVILDEAALRRSAGSPDVWTDQLSHLITMAETRSVVVQVLPFSRGVHHLMNGHLSVLWQSDGSSVAYLEGNRFGELIEDPEQVTFYRLAYDQLRDLALPPTDSVACIERVLEEYTA